MLPGVAWLYRHVMGRPSPRVIPSGTSRGPAPSAGAPPAPTRADFENALRRRREYLDISPADLEEIYYRVRQEARKRTLRELTCADIMSPRPITVTPDCRTDDALALLRRHHIKALPVVDATRTIVGIVTATDLGGHDRLSLATSGGTRCSQKGRAHLAVRLIMQSAVLTVSATTHVAALLSLFATTGHHHIPVVSGENRIVGMVTGSDVLKGLGHR